MPGHGVLNRRSQSHGRSRSKHTNPWARGPAAWSVARRGEEIRAKVGACPKAYLGLRHAARTLGLSTQPLRDWTRLGLVRRDGPRGTISRTELLLLLTRIEAEVEPFDSASFYAKRLTCRRGGKRTSAGKLDGARFAWPRGRAALAPVELARLVGCHPSLICRALRGKVSGSRLRGRRRTPGRWEITRQAWESAHPGSLIRKAWLPPLPPGELIDTGAVAWHLRECGVAGMTRLGVRRLIRSGLLAGQHRQANGRRWYVRRAGLIAYRKNFRKSLDRRDQL